MRKMRFAWFLGVALALAPAFAGSVGAQEEQSVPVEQAEGGRLWFVELAGAPVADGNSLSAVKAEKAAFRKAAAAAGIPYVERRAFDVLFNGFSVEVDLVNRTKLAQVPGVKAMYPVETIQAPSPEVVAGSAPDLAAAITMTGADVAQNTLGLSGAGVRVGIIDTGVDYDHPAFGGSGTNGTTVFPSARVVAGYDFVGDNYNSSGSGSQLIPVPDDDPDDCGGHGTHVAGIVGADGGGIKGVAPGVSLGAYRVFGCTGTTSADIMIAAMERALADGMQVVNQSIGSARQWPEYPTAAAATRMVNKGVVMVASIGNNGPNGTSPDGIYSAGAPGVGAKVIGVASYDNLQSTQSAFRVDPGASSVGFNAATGAPPPPASGTWPISGPSLTTGCNAADFAGFTAGHVALISRGTCTFYQKAINAMNAGASAVVLYNNTAGQLNPTVAGTPPVTIPVVAITQAQGQAIAALPGAELTWGPFTITTPLATGGLISGFSSFGLAPDLSVKPDLGAPGGSIYSAYPIELGSYASLSGTSMASPHVAGGAALVLEARPLMPSNAMRAWLQGSADPKNWFGNPGLGFLDNVHRQGAGMLDVVGTVEATTVVEPSKLALGESEFGPVTRTLTIKNDGPSSVTYDLGHAPGLSTGPNPVNPPATTYASVTYITGFATVAFSVPSVTVPPGGAATVDVTITANAGLVDRGVYGGYITLTPQGSGSILRVPYAGFKGDYQSIQVLVPTASGFPWLAQLVGPSYFNRPAGATYTMVGTDIPYFLMHLDHQSRRIRLEAFDAVSGKAWHRASDDEYVGRNSTPTGFFAFAWDGTTFTGKGKNANQWRTAPNGQYVVKVSVLKALGDENDPAHWETWTSPVITIARP